MRELLIFLQSLDRDQLYSLRNELEIAIYHAEDYLRQLFQLTAGLAVGAGLFGLLSRDLTFALSPILAVGLAYTTRTLESRVAAAALFALDVLCLFDYPRALFPGAGIQAPPGTLAVSFLLLGTSMLAFVLYLGRLRRLRALIPLPPAPHLHMDSST